MILSLLTRAIGDFLTDLRTLASDYLAAFRAAEQPTHVGDPPFTGYTSGPAGIEDRDDDDTP